MERICKKCGVTFEIPQAEMDYYKKKNMVVPRECPGCRGEVGEFNSYASSREDIKPRGYKRPYFIIGALVLAIVIALAIGYMSVNKSGERANSTPTEPEVTTEAAQ